MNLLLLEIRTVSWINEEEMSGSMDDLMTSQFFRNFEMLDARIASAL